MHLPAPLTPVRNNCWMGSCIHLINCSQKTVDCLESFLSKFYPACHFDANGIKLGSNSKMTDNRATTSEKLCLWVLTNLYVMYTLLVQQYSQKNQSHAILFLHVYFYTGKSFFNRWTLKQDIVTPSFYFQHLAFKQFSNPHWKLKLIIVCIIVYTEVSFNFIIFVQNIDCWQL